MKAPSANLIVWAMFDSSKKIGDENDKEFQEIEINSYLKSYLENPDRFNSICDDSALGHYENKSSMKGVLSEDDYMNLTTYFMEFKNNIKEEDVYKKPKYSKEEEQNILTKAKNENKKIIVYATSTSCYFCKKMDKEVFTDNEIKTLYSLPFSIRLISKILKSSSLIFGEIRLSFFISVETGFEAVFCSSFLQLNK